jgi:hypothetical protein
MAIPPDPIDLVMPAARAAVVGEVARVLEQDPQAPLPKVKEGTTDAPGLVARQVVELRVDEVLFGEGGVWPKAGAAIQLEKPAGDYALSAGNGGPFLIGDPAAPGGKPVILGRYGPDTYTVELIRHAARKHGKG